MPARAEPRWLLVGLRQLKAPTVTQRAGAYRAAIDLGGLRTFVECFWQYAEPGEPYRETWHVGALCEFVQAWHFREFSRGVISIPPGCGKSLIVDVFHPAWAWAIQPSRRRLGMSYDVGLLRRDAGKQIAIMRSPEYLQAFPHTRLRAKVPAEGDFYTTMGGHRFSTSPGAKGGTGRHFHDISVNDPIKPIDAQRGGADLVAAYRQVQGWWDGTMPTRRMPGFGWLLTMQRLAEGDLAGVQLDRGGCEHLCLPMRYVPQAYWVVQGEQSWTDRLEQRTEPGELLCPDVKSEKDVQEMTQDLGDHAEAQMQQNPIPRSGGLVTEHNLRLQWVDPPTKGLRIQTWDFAAKGEESTHSAVSGQLWEAAVHDGVVRELTNTIAERDRGAMPEWRALLLPKATRFYLLDEVWGIMTSPESEAAFEAVQAVPDWGLASARVIEEKASGIGIIQRYERRFTGVVAFHEVDEDCAKLAKENKVDRLRPALSDFAGDLILTPQTFITKPGIGATVGLDKRPINVDTYRKEILAFPRGSKDDRVDATSMALARLSRLRNQYWDAVRALAKRTEGGLARLTAGRR